ncbi:ATP-dependent DNA ligase [Propioniciclava coleopterorum]|uniref:DNA ligase (ATP) n=1 Tax=Propioniciclava coleopterorum TaxID=2714937 RepID=A0A6G7Y5T8_9ACTN|nr:ATP-dependent DNA ligase [Propioniciclava coleopterorum]QIK72008.1 ATP-dependent DNA ligase [Propioniciclava coleopterorum]
MSYEPKWDGFRCIAARDGDTVALWSRSRKPLTDYFPEVAAACRRWLPEQAVVDGEIIVRSGEPGAERLDWEALSVRIHPAAKRVRQLVQSTPAELVTFDLLALADLDLMPLPQRQRREALLTLLGDAPRDSGLHVTRATDDPELAADWFTHFEGAGLDGVMIKPTDAPYSPGARTMMKLKHARTAEAVIIGFSRSRTGHGVGSLHLGLYDDGVLLPVGGIGAFPDAARGVFEEILEPLLLPEDEAHDAPRPSAVSRLGPRDFVPLRPVLVVELAYDQLEGKRFRNSAQFVRWRPDRDPESCRLDQLEAVPGYDLDAVLRP